MERILDDFWWVPIFSVPLLAVLIWGVKKQVSDDTTPSERKQIMTIGIMASIAAGLYPSAARTSTSLFTFPRVLLAFALAGLFGTALGLVLKQRKKRRSPNKAL